MTSKMTKRILFFACFVACFLGVSSAQVQVLPYTNPKIQLWNGSAVCSGCKLNTYTAGTTSQLATYTDSLGSVANANPVILDSNGMATVYLQAASCYKFVLQTSAGVTLWTQDNVCADNQSASYLAEQAAPTCVSLFDLLWGDSTAHRVKMCNNGGSADTVVGAATTDTFSNKTIDTANSNTLKVNGNTLAATAGTATVTLPNSTDTLVGRATTDTLTNKTIDTAGPNTIKVNGNTLAATSGTATVTIPNSTDTLVGRATTDTLTNKTLTSPVMTSPTINTGITAGSGFKHQRFGATCTTAASSFATCTTNLNWTVAFADNNYTWGCQAGTTGSGLPTINSVIQQAAGAGLTIQVVALTAVAAQFSAVECWAFHD